MYPVLFSFGPVHLYSYGFFVAIGTLSAIFFLKAQAREVSVDPETLVDLAITTIISGFVVARIYYVIQFWSYFEGNPLDVIKIWQGGIILYGGLIGGVLGFSAFVFLKKLPFWRLLDVCVISMSLAQGFGRLGCFFNGCCFGRETHLLWAVQFPFSEFPLHPTQIYESSFCFVLAGFLYLFWKRKKTRAGLTSLLYFTIYPAGRFLIEFFRGDQVKVYLNLSFAQWISIGFMLLVSFTAFIIYGKKNTRRST